MMTATVSPATVSPAEYWIAYGRATMLSEILESAGRWTDCQYWEAQSLLSFLEGDEVLTILEAWMRETERRLALGPIEPPTEPYQKWER